MQVERLCYSVSDAAVRLSSSRLKLWKLIKKGELRSIKLDGKRLIPEAALKELVEKLSEKAA